MEAVVVDTSAILAVLLEEPLRPALISAVEGRRLLGAPTLPWELGNALVAGYRRKRLSVVAVRSAWSSFALVPVHLVSVAVDQGLEAAMASGLYAYDGYVLEAARAQRAPLLTLDRGLARAAAAMGIALMEVAG